MKVTHVWIIRAAFSAFIQCAVIDKDKDLVEFKPSKQWESAPAVKVTAKRERHTARGGNMEHFMWDTIQEIKSKKKIVTVSCCNKLSVSKSQDCFFFSPRSTKNNISLRLHTVCLYSFNFSMSENCFTSLLLKGRAGIRLCKKGRKGKLKMC